MKEYFPVNVRSPYRKLKSMNCTKICFRNAQLRGGVTEMQTDEIEAREPREKRLTRKENVGNTGYICRKST